MNKKKSPTPKPGEKNIIKFPARKQPDFFSGQDTYDVLEREKIKIAPELRVLMRLPRLMTRGVHEELEFFDSFSIPPFPFREDHSPSYCIATGMPIPEWIRQVYFSITKEKRTHVFTYVDIPRRIVLQESFSDQAKIASKIYSAMMRLPGEKQE
ncbi:hypothetical protein KKE38_04390 [Candidatus Micrarchaeota archaeon]|nr:hypothetical protein [Candidatus Micrarchaeota archaeon]MBU1682034.1 hypothetical protein [Candidatus Micrarchaeota archaeon]